VNKLRYEIIPNYDGEARDELLKLDNALAKFTSDYINKHFPEP